MKPTPLLTVAFILHSFFLSAQLHDQYLRGSIQFADGRKEPVLILNEETEKLNYSVSIKDSSHKKSKKTYSAYEILAVEFENGKKFTQITFAPHGSKDSITVLGRVIVTGRINLYQVHQNNAELLVAVKNEEIFPIQKDEFTSLDTEIKKHHYNSYLLSALRDAPEAMREKAMKIAFSEKDISLLILDYNKLYDNPAEIIKTKTENRNFWIAGASFKKTKEYPYGIFGFINYRLYITDFSRSTSFNIGLHYYNYQFKSAYSPISIVTGTRSIASLPVFVQQNLLNKRVRPYVFAGVNISYMNTKADKPGYEDVKGFQRSYGFNLLGGGGMEINILPNLMLKADYRYENVAHGLMGGVAVIF
ncbi:MAG: porin family protein [Lacibacter sp.]|nr:porin family protein [Lacibacter sp.]